MVATADQVGRLAAGAKGGTAGVQAYDQARQQNDASRDAALASLQSDAAKAGAPAALTAQLGANITGAAGVADTNFQNVGASDAYARGQDLSGTNQYDTEAASALPLIRGEADRIYALSAAGENRALQERLTLLAASQAKRASSSAGQLSDAELRNRLMGQAIANRQAQIGDLEKRYRAEAVATQAQRPTGSGPGEQLTGRGSFTDPSNYVDPTVGAPNPYMTAVANLEKERAQLSQQAAALQGPGITGEAQKIGLAAGIDPSRVYGLLGPQQEAEYLNAQKSLGLYGGPGKQTVTDLVASPAVAAKALNLTPDALKAAQNTTYFDWNLNNRATQKAFGSWVKANAAKLNLQTDPSSGNAIIPPDQLAGLQKAFENDPTNHRYKDNVITSLEDDARAEIAKHTSWDEFLQKVAADAGYANNPNPTRLGLQMVMPLFQAAAVAATHQVPAYAQG